MLGTESGRKQSSVRFARPRWFPLATDPLCSGTNRAQPLRFRTISRHFAISPKNPDRLAVGIPFTFLRPEIASRRLPGGKLIERALSSLIHPANKKCMNQKSRIAEPEPLIVVRSRKNIFGRMKNHCPNRRIIQKLDSLIGHPKPSERLNHLFPRRNLLQRNHRRPCHFLISRQRNRYRNLYLSVRITRK